MSSLFFSDVAEAHVNISLSEDQVECLEEVGRVENSRQEEANDEEDSKVYWSVEHGPEAERGEIPA